MVNNPIRTVTGQASAMSPHDGLRRTLERDAEIAVERVPDVEDVLLPERLIEPILNLTRLLGRFRQPALAARERIAGNGAHQEERHHRDGDEDEYKTSEAAQNVRGDGDTPCRCRTTYRSRGCSSG